MSSKNENFICGVIEGFYGRPWTSEQRKDLFQKLKKWGLNSYVYAPKDDSKHRANWRDLYTVEEAEHLTSLITSAIENGITFYYALSPGLDITYSSSKEVITLKRKLEQVSQFGCTAFALLFDDIEPEMSEADKEVFQSFAHAQVSVTNDVYQHLGQPKFLICPTQYCASRAVPNVKGSEYLTTLGGKLAPNIDIMWTGSKVISRNLSVESIDEVAGVLRRPPVIWDNLHANDYDTKRVFLGPYQGRPPDLIPHLRGVMSNPNCEFWTNFVPIHTLAQWSRCTADASQHHNESVSSDIKLETEAEDGDEVPSSLPVNIYHPRTALKNALIEWLPEFSKSKQASGVIMKPQLLGSLAPAVLAPPPLASTCLALTGTTPSPPTSQLSALASVCTTVNGSAGPIVMNSLLSDNKVCTEPMDCNALPPNESPKPSPTETEEIFDSNGKEESNSPGSTAMVLDPDQSHVESLCDGVSMEDISLLCDLFYLPFEHGAQGVALLHEFCWLNTNACLLSDQSSSHEDVEEWHARAKKFETYGQNVDRLFLKLNGISNKELLYELYPYVWEIRASISTLNSYIKWLVSGQAKIENTSEHYMRDFTWHSKGWKRSFMSGEQEPWVFRGGLTADLQRLLAIDGSSDLLIYKIPTTASTVFYTIREFKPSDAPQIEAIAKATVPSPEAAEYHYKLASELLKLNPDLNFVVEEDSNEEGREKTVVAFTFAFVKSANIDVKSHEVDDAVKKVIESSQCRIPSLAVSGALSSLVDQSVTKRLMLCLLAALFVNRSCGVYTMVNDPSLVEFYLRLGFVEVSREENIVLMNRVF